MRRFSLCLCLGLIAAGGAGCNAANVFVAAPSDYGDYRSVRLAPDFDESMARAWHYLARHPDGRYRARVRRYFDRNEPLYYKIRRRSIAGLEAYLRALPDGPHAEEALDRLVELRTERNHDLNERQAVAELALSDAELQKRATAGRLVGQWAAWIADPRLWRGSLSDAPGEFLAVYQLSLPRPLCLPEGEEERPGYQHCFKTLDRGFRIPVEGRLVERVVGFDVELELSPAWQLVRATISGPSLFVYSREAEDGSALDASDDAVRRDAVDAFLRRFVRDLGARDVLCEGGTAGSGNTLLTCDELEVRIELGQGDANDTIVVRRFDAEEVSRSDP